MIEYTFQNSDGETITIKAETVEEALNQLDIRFGCDHTFFLNLE